MEMDPKVMMIKFDNDNHYYYYYHDSCIVIYLVITWKTFPFSLSNGNFSGAESIALAWRAMKQDPATVDG